MATPIDDLLAPFAGLCAPVEPADWEASLRLFAELMKGVDATRRAVAREAALQRLGDLGVRAPGRMLNAALGDGDEHAGEGGTMRLEDPEPWPHPVDAAELLDELSQAILRFVVLGQTAADALALWSLHSWCLDAAEFTPRLAITSPAMRCGKSTLLGLILLAVRRALPASNISAAAVFRSVEKFGPSLLIDEGDSFLRDKDELRGILNSGHSRSAAFVVRCHGDDAEPRRFSTWAPVAVACIGSLPETLADRAIEMRLRRKGPGEKVDRLRGRVRREVEALFVEWRRRALRWATDSLPELRELAPEPPTELDDRASDNWDILLRIAAAAGGDWPARARAAAIELSALRADEEGSRGVQLLKDLNELFEARGFAHAEGRMETSAILDALQTLMDRPWADYRKGKAINARQLGGLLRPFGVTSRTIKFAGVDAKGYLYRDLEDPIRRYLPIPSVAPLRPPNSSHEPATEGENGAAKRDASVAGKWPVLLERNGATDPNPLLARDHSDRSRLSPAEQAAAEAAAYRAQRPNRPMAGEAIEENANEIF